jgi:hypothetical protein
MLSKLFQRASQAPTNPAAPVSVAAFDVADLYEGPAVTGDVGESAHQLPLDEKLRQAYFWIVNNAIISPSIAVG